jgi:hypothetical protein
MSCVTASVFVSVSVCPTAAAVPLGYFLKGPGVAAPCPKGTYTNSTRSLAQCVACPLGTTTVKEGAPSSDACTGVWALVGQAVLTQQWRRPAKQCTIRWLLSNTECELSTHLRAAA